MFGQVVNKFITVTAFRMEIYMKAKITLIPGDGIGPDSKRSKKST